MRLCIMRLGPATSLFRVEISLFGQEKFPVRLRREPGYNYLNLLANLMQKLSRQAGFFANSLLVSLLSGNWGPAESGPLRRCPVVPRPHVLTGRRRLRLACPHDNVDSQNRSDHDE